MSDDIGSQVIGLTEREAASVAAENGLTLRVTRRDQNSFMVSQDLRFDRLNIEIDGGVVTEATLG